MILHRKLGPPGPNCVRISKAGKICQFKKKIAPTDFHDLEGKPDVDRVIKFEEKLKT